MKAKLTALIFGVIFVGIVAVLQAQGTFWVVQNGVMTFNGPVKINGTLTATSASSSFLSVTTTGNGLSINSNGSLFINGVKLFDGTAPTISSGFGSSPSIVSSNGSATFRVNVGTGGAASTGVVGLPAATTGWNCQVTDQGPGAIDATRQTASTTNTVTVGAAAAWTASDILLFNCNAF